MGKLRKYIETWLDGKSIKGIHVSLLDIRECIDIYNEIVIGNKPCFINGNVKNVIEKCGIGVIEHGIGWRIK